MWHTKRKSLSLNSLSLSWGSQHLETSSEIRVRSWELLPLLLSESLFLFLNLLEKVHSILYIHIFLLLSSDLWMFGMVHLLKVIINFLRETFPYLAHSRSNLAHNKHLLTWNEPTLIKLKVEDIRRACEQGEN